MADNLTLIKETEKSSEKMDRIQNRLEPMKKASKKKKPRRHGGYFGQKGPYKKMLEEAGDY